MNKENVFFIGILLILNGFTSCVKMDLAPVVDNEAVPTSIKLPIVLTDSIITFRTPTEAMLGFKIIDDGGGIITSKGVCWSTFKSPTINMNKYEAGGRSLTVSHCHIGGLEINTTYYVRAYATNEAGTAYGNNVSFTTPVSLKPIFFNPKLTYGSVLDIDGNLYKTIQIGYQTWFAENLKTTRYNDGEQIPHGHGAPAGYTDWFDNGDGTYRWYNGAYCWYENDSSLYKDVFGAIYNWHSVGTGKLCPKGWHVPGDSEWKTLTDFLGGEEASVSKLKESGSTHWGSSNSSTNESGFTAVPAGDLCGWGFCPSSCVWWTCNLGGRYEPKVPWAHLISLLDSKVIFAEEPQSYGFSVRCLKD